MHAQGWTPFPFQEACWQACLLGESGLLHAPTGSGKTYALWLGCLATHIAQHPGTWGSPLQPRAQGLRVLWITPLRALAKDVARAMEAACEGIGLPWRVALRTGDTSSAEREKQRKQWPEALVTTPETLHLLLAQKDASKTFRHLEAVVVDEWHELLGTKRGVQVELALAYLRALRPGLRVWGISATIGNLDEAAAVLLPQGGARLVQASVPKRLEARSILPPPGTAFPWAGHLGSFLMPQVLPIIEASRTTLIFTNTRAQTEIWYQRLLALNPALAGLMAMHHGSLDREVRDWVEEALHKGQLKVVVCTSSLDLGVDFRPVETVVQVGSPKGLARFLQRAGRSGHRPGLPSRIYFLPTHALELVEGATLRQAAEEASAGQSQALEQRTPLRHCLDVLVQFLVTLAVGEGFRPQEALAVVAGTHAYQGLSEADWAWCLSFISTGGQSLSAYPEYRKVLPDAEGVWRIASSKMALQHRLSMGTIVSEPLVKVKLKKGGMIGTVEEYYAAKLQEGDVFWFAGRNLAFVRLKDMVLEVAETTKKANSTPRWMGGRLPLSRPLSERLRRQLGAVAQGPGPGPEMEAMEPLLALQRRWSRIPRPGQLLVEQVRTDDGCHWFVYPFQGRLVHEAMAALTAYRLSLQRPLTISMAMNDYGFELLCDEPLPEETLLDRSVWSLEGMEEDLRAGLNQTELAKRKFREIAQIGGLIFPGYPGRSKQRSHLNASSTLLFEVFEAYEPGHLLVKQAHDETLAVQVDQPRLEQALREALASELLLQRPPRPTPLAFPLLADRLRETLSSESLADRLAKMQAQLEAG
jgi:ATP-dependent Lhr-like helicase